VFLSGLPGLEKVAESEILSDVVAERSPMTQVVIARRRRRTVFLLLSLAVLACSATSQSMVPRYITSASPIEYLCVAVDPLQKDGVWWWQSFTSGCATRSTGPGVFKADQATVSHATRSTVVITFRVGMHSTTEPFREIHLVIEGDSMHSIASGAGVPVVRRDNLDVPPIDGSLDRPRADRRRGER